MPATIHPFPGADKTMTTSEAALQTNGGGGDIVSTVRKKAILVELTMTKPQLAAFDKEAARELAHAHNANEKRVGVHKKLYPEEATEKLLTAMGRCRTYHLEMTLPFTSTGTKGPRLIPNVRYLEYNNKMRELIQDAEKEAMILAQKQQSLKALAQLDGELGSLYEEQRYPEQAVFEAAFSFNVRFRPIPDSSHFLIDIADEDRKAMEEDIRASIEEAMGDVYFRIVEAIKGMIEKMPAYKPAYVDEDGTKHKAEKVFKDSLVGNIRELAAVLPVMNVADDPRITEITQRINADLCGFDAEQLRDSDMLREGVTERAEEILNTLREFLA